MMSVTVVPVVLHVGSQRALCKWNVPSVSTMADRIFPSVMKNLYWWLGEIKYFYIKDLSSEIAVTCSGAHAPWRQTVRRREAVEHADILRCQELHKLGIVEHFPVAVQDGCRLVRDVNDLPRDEGDSYSKYILRVKRFWKLSLAFLNFKMSQKLHMKLQVKEKEGEFYGNDKYIWLDFSKLRRPIQTHFIKLVKHHQNFAFEICFVLCLDFQDATWCWSWIGGGQRRYLQCFWGYIQRWCCWSPQ